jgi:hypothetical protein
MEHEVSGPKITRQQEELYMHHRHNGCTQEVAAAKAGLSVRSGRRIDQAGGPRLTPKRDWRTRHDPLEAVWESELLPLLRAEPSLTGTTLLEYLLDHYPEHYDQSVLRTLQRRVKLWNALEGPDKDIIFRQEAVTAVQGFSDFSHPNDPVLINGKPFAHLFFQFRLAFSGWRSVSVVQGGESFVALSEGLQRALQLAGGSPREHRTDSLSAARNNRQNVWTEDYEALCIHYGMEPTRNNLGLSHENGVVECANGSFKNRLSQQLKLRGSNDFRSIDEFDAFVDHVVHQLNRRVRKRFMEEQMVLQPLPDSCVPDYQTLTLKVTRSATMEVKRVLYTVPSRLIGENLHIRLYHDKLEGYVGQAHALTLPRIYPKPGESRARRIDYRHVIRALAAKPQAFRYSQLRDDLLPSDTYRTLWEQVDQKLPKRDACKWIVAVLRLAYEYDDETKLGSHLLDAVLKGSIPDIKKVQERYIRPGSLTDYNTGTPQHDLASYDDLLVLGGAQHQPLPEASL